MSSSNNSNKVAEIFSFAGLAFKSLGELTMHLQSGQENSGSSKWEDDDIEMFRNAVKRFGDDLNKISENVKSKAANQIKANIRKKTYEQARIPLDQSPATSSTTSNSNNVEKIPATSTIADNQVPIVESEVEIS